jgi:hypothetical protein
VDTTGVPIEFDVPYLPALAGLSLHHQAIVLHPQAATPLGAVASNSIEAVLGLR